MDTESAYWFLSTISQTLAAIVGLIGMVTVYKLQMIKNSINELMTVSRKLRDSHYNPPVAVTQISSDFVKIFESETLKKNPLNTYKGWDDTLKELYEFYNGIKHLMAQKKKIIRYFKIFIFVYMFSIFFSLVGLAYIPTFAILTAIIGKTTVLALLGVIIMVAMGYSIVLIRE